jgi:hypothetical protein
MGCGGTVEFLVDAVFNYPTFSEAYKVAALDVMNNPRVGVHRARHRALVARELSAHAGGGRRTGWSAAGRQQQHHAHHYCRNAHRCSSCLTHRGTRRLVRPALSTNSVLRKWVFGAECGPAHPRTAQVEEGTNLGPLRKSELTY